MNLATQTSRNPLHVFLTSKGAGRSEHPVPLISCDHDVNIEAGLAIVTNRRVFRNAEDQSIEAMITFPVPVHATVFELRAKVGERSLVAKATKKGAARATYEDAIDRGKTAVLHEEVLRGIHMLSVAHIPPGATIEVTCIWAITLTVIKGEGHLCIPLTVGDVYGRSPLADVDDLITGGKSQMGKVTVKSPDASVRLVEGTLSNGQATVPLNRPIDLVVGEWLPRPLTGVTARGDRISMRIQPHLKSEEGLNLAVLVDHSGSMNEAVRAAAGARTKHAEVKAALLALSKRLEHKDIIELWEFDHTSKLVGSTTEGKGLIDVILPRSPGKRLENLVHRLSGPAGGTEIGLAISTALQQSTVQDILVITDGKSHALDVQGLARKGGRISVLLVGEDSLEANIGHLAALTGGEILVSGGADLVDCFSAAVATQRTTGRDENKSQEQGEAARAYGRGGAKITFDISERRVTPELSTLERAVAAVWAGFLLPRLSDVDAAELAEAEGLVTHLTSLVLVDEASESQGGLPAQRKVPLPEPATSRWLMDSLAEKEIPHLNAATFSDPAYPKDINLSQWSQPRLQQRQLFRTEKASPLPSSWEVADRIDWSRLASALAAGDISGLPAEIQTRLHQFAEIEEIKLAALQTGMAPLVLVISLIACLAGPHANRQADRLARLAKNKIDKAMHAHLISLIESCGR